MTIPVETDIYLPTITTDGIHGQYEKLFIEAYSERRKTAFKDTGSTTLLTDGPSTHQSDNVKFGNVSEKHFIRFLKYLNLPNVEIITSDAQYRGLPFDETSTINHLVQLLGDTKKTQIDLLLRITEPDGSKTIIYIEIKCNVTLDSEKTPAIKAKKRKIEEYYREDTPNVESYVLCTGVSSSRSKLLFSKPNLGEVIGVFDLLERLTGRKKGEEGDVLEFDILFNLAKQVKNHFNPAFQKKKKLLKLSEKLLKVNSELGEELMTILNTNDYLSKTVKNESKATLLKKKQIKEEFDINYLFSDKKEVQNLIHVGDLENDLAKFNYFKLPSDFMFSNLNFSRKDHEDLCKNFKETKSKSILIVGYSPFIYNLYSGGNEYGSYIKGMTNKLFKGNEYFIERHSWDVKELKNLVITNF